MEVHSEGRRASILRAAPKAVSGELRRHRRLPLELAGRYMRADRSEHVCTLKDISVGGACVAAEIQPEVGERVIVYFDQLGGFDGMVSRNLPDGFAFQFKISEHKREKLAAQIMWLVNREAFPDEMGRAHERVGATGRRTTLGLDEGVVIDVELLDLSVSGASIGTPARPAVGEDVSVGKVKAIVRRHHANGIGVQFLAVQSAESLLTNFP